MSTITITMNGQKVSARPGQTILRAAQAAGIDIPTLCHHPALAPIGACRVCLVEVAGQRTLQPACTFPVADRMEVQTESPKVVRARKFVLELIFSERNHFCMACEMSGGCELQDLGYRYGLDHWTYPTYTQRFPVDASPPHHLLDHNRCVLCRRCLRACAELVANHTLDLRLRGANTMLTADMDVPLGQSTCVNCGTCVNVCPTGALIDKRSAFMARPADVERVATVCSQCSLGCGVNVVMHRGHVLRLESLWDAPVNGGLLCRTGRFEALADGRPRLLAPMLKEKGQHVPVSWEAALAAASQRLGATAPKRLGLFTTTRLTNEAMGLLHAIFVKHLKAAQRGASHGAAPGMAACRCGKLADIADSDLILLAGSDPARDQPVASFLIKRALDRGARLVTVESRPTELTAFAETILTPRQISQAVALARAAEKPVVIYGAGLTPAAATALRKLADQGRLHPPAPRRQHAHRRNPRAERQTKRGGLRHPIHRGGRGKRDDGSGHAKGRAQGLRHRAGELWLGANGPRRPGPAHGHLAGALRDLHQHRGDHPPGPCGPDPFGPVPARLGHPGPAGGTPGAGCRDRQGRDSRMPSVTSTEKGEPVMGNVLIATDWLAACAGCHMSLLDLDERLVELLYHVRFTSSPVTDLKHPPESGVTVGILTGAISNTHNIEVARRMRSRCTYLIAVGDCATFGGIVAARNLVGTQAALTRAYLETESTVDGLIPDSPELGRPLDTVTGIGDVVKVDIFLPGCPPRPEDFHYVFAEVLSGRIPVVLPRENFRYD